MYVGMCLKVCMCEYVCVTIDECLCDLEYLGVYVCKYENMSVRMCVYLPLCSQLLLKTHPCPLIPRGAKVCRNKLLCLKHLWAV